MNKKQVEVAIALIMQQGQILIGWRDENLHQGGCYEFAGGKVEKDEFPEQAVIREVQEEVGISVTVIRLFEELSFDYPDRAVHLYFYLCQPVSESIKQGWQWVDLDQLHTFTFPAANLSIIQRLTWTRQIAITTRDQALNIKSDIGLCYLRHRQSLAEDMVRLQDQNVQMIVPVLDYLTLNASLQQAVFAVHLNATQLHQYSSLAEFTGKNVIAACHHLRDIQQANRLGCDAILLSPVHQTSTHPESIGMGWIALQTLAKQARMLVYALGGVKQSELETARCHAAYGVAGISDFWQD